VPQNARLIERRREGVELIVVEIAEWCEHTPDEVHALVERMPFP
jgi:hypothetical protein